MGLKTCSVSQLFRAILHHDAPDVALWLEERSLSPDMFIMEWYEQPIKSSSLVICASCHFAVNFELK
jgi:hypothetical protein